MAAQKVYQIQINGLTESVKSVDALNDSLNTLENRIKALEGKSVSVGSKSSGGGSKSSALSEEEKLEQQIQKIDEKRVAYSKEIYQNYLAAKDVLKEVEKDQKAIAAAERVQANAYSNTMEGIKQKLADLKSVHFTTDISTDEFKKQTEEIDALTKKLKGLEEEYGVYTRNVGNYASAFEKVKVNVGGVVREFDTAREASRTLNNELKILAANGDTDTEKFKNLRQAVIELESKMRDAKKPMDNLMDTMQSIVAIASLSQGFSALFGFDDAEIQRSIQKLVALQNILKGIETINTQFQAREGIGGWLAKGNSAIDNFTKKLFGLNTAAKATNTTIAATGTASKTAATGLGTASVAANTASKSFKAATIAATALRVVLSALGIGLVIGAISALIDVVGSLITKQNEAIENQKKLAEGIKDSQKEYAKAGVEIAALKSKLDNFNGTKKQEEKLVKSLNDKYRTTLGQYKSVKEWQEALIKKGSSYARVLQLQAENQALLNLYTEQYIKLFEAKRLQAEGGDKWKEWLPWNWGGKSAQDKANENVKSIEEELNTILDLFKRNEKQIAEINESSEIMDFAPQIDKNGKKSADAAKKSQEEITRKQIEAMQDGLNKTLMQLTEDERQTINKIKENGVKVQQLVKQTEEVYAQLRLKAMDSYLQKLTKTVEDYSKKIASIRFQIDTKDIELQIKDIEEEIRHMSEDIVPINNTLTTKLEYESEINRKGINKDDLYFANVFNYERNKAQTEGEIKEYFKWLDEYVSTLSEEVKSKFSAYTNLATGEIDTDYYRQVEDYIREHYKRELQILSSFGYLENETLSESFAYRLSALKQYNKEYIKTIDIALDDELNLKLDAAEREKKESLRTNKIQYDETVKTLRDRKNEIEDNLNAIEKLGNFSNKKLSKDFKDSNAEQIKQLEDANGTKIETYKQYYETLRKSLIKNQDETNKQITEVQKQYSDNVNQIAKEFGQKIIETENEINNKRQKNAESYYNKQISNYRDFLSKINDEASKQPVVDTAGFGIVNIVQTKRNYREILDAAKTTFLNIDADREELDNSFKNGLISPENYNAILNQLNDLENETKQTFQTVVQNYKRTNGDFFQSIQVYVQEVINSFNTIMGAIQQSQDITFDKEQKEIDKWNDALQKALDKQEEMISEHKNKVDSIEDELANSRGDRRQHLIDQLNAEIAAERAAEKEKQRIQKQQEANKKKQDALDDKRQRAQWHRQIIQAVVNGAQAITMAAINTWPIPAIPMMSLAASTTAAQIAIMSANKPYAKGGQLDGGIAVGNRHRDGGIKVLGGRAEIEGGEFITNRISTQMNAPLLEFINSKKKRIDVSDMIEFYSSGSVKKNIANVRTKFEDGGYMPTLPNALDVRDQLQNIIINQDNRPIYVSVVDINNKQEEVRKVQTLAGL